MQFGVRLRTSIPWIRSITMKIITKLKDNGALNEGSLLAPQATLQENAKGQCRYGVKGLVAEFWLGRLAIILQTPVLQGSYQPQPRAGDDRHCQAWAFECESQSGQLKKGQRNAHHCSPFSRPTPPSSMITILLSGPVEHSVIRRRRKPPRRACLETMFYWCCGRGCGAAARCALSLVLA